MKIKKIRYIGIISIVAVTAISEIIANIPQTRELGLAGVANLFAPLLVGFIGLIIFLIISFFVKNKSFLWISLFGISVYIIYVGIDLYF